MTTLYYPTMKSILLMYMFLCIFRIFNALIIQSQFDPDEYHQTLEPAYCEAFGTHGEKNYRNCAYTWEWTRRWDTSTIQQKNNYVTNFLQTSLEGPVRSYLSVLPTYILYMILKYMEWDTFFLISKGPIILNAVLVAAPTDLSIWYMSHIIQYQYLDNCYEPKENTQNNSNNNKQRVTLSLQTNIVRWCLFCTLLSWFHGYALIRTYSNSVETVLLAVGMALISPELFGSRKHQQQQHYYQYRSALSFILGGMSVAIRFTSLAAWVPMGLILSIRQANNHISVTGSSPRRSLWSWCRIVLFPCATCGILGIWISLVMDRWFYGFWTIPFLGNLHFNVILGYGSLYGTHPFHWYWTAGIPAITGIFLPFVLLSLGRGNNHHDSSNNNSGGDGRNEKDDKMSWKCTLWWIIIPYATLHSFSAHKEFRFMMPILPPLILLAGYEMSLWVARGKPEPLEGYNPPRRRAIILGLVLFVLNIPHLLFLSLLHQRAPLDVNRRIIELIVRKEQKEQVSSSVSAVSPHPNNNYSVHYWMGCHSTPLYSHLHIRLGGRSHDIPTQIDTRTLDCSPSCRLTQDCESDAFHQDPVGFIQHEYLSANVNDDSCDDEGTDQTCEQPTSNNAKATLPDFVAVYANEAYVLQQSSLFQDMGYVEVGRFIQGINGLSVSVLSGSNGDDNNTNANVEKHHVYRHIALFGGLVELSLDEMLLFAKKEYT